MPPHAHAFPHRLGRALAVGALTVLLSIPASASGLLNDTGQTRCVDGSGTAWAASCNTADTGGLAGQDGRIGRDAAARTPGQLTKAGGGVAGFDFTAIALDGQVTSLGNHACVYDNVTDLLWSVESLGPMTWYAAIALIDDGSYSRCGHDAGWRLPTRRELMSIVNYGAETAPAIDVAYFPGTRDWYWTSNGIGSTPDGAWEIFFGTGLPAGLQKTSDFVRVRLVHSGHLVRAKVP